MEKCYEISSNLANLIRNLIRNLICSSPSQSNPLSIPTSELPFTEEEEEEEEEERKDINNGWSVNEE